MSFRSGLALLAVGIAAAALWTLPGCGSQDAGIHMEGSDTMVNVAQAWAEQYHVRNPEVMVQVLGGGSGLGLASLIEGNCDLANSSRSIEDKEVQRLRDKRHLKPKEFIVGYDALAVYVHKDNPLDRFRWTSWRKSSAKTARSPNGRNSASTARRSATTRSCG